MAEATTSWGGLTDTYSGNVVATGSGTYFYSGSNKIEQDSTYQDRRTDGNGAYTQANFQPWWLNCASEDPTCHWEWGDITTKQTARLSVADGKKSAYVLTTRVWPTNRDYAQVCIDINNHPDPCATSSYLNP